MWEPATRVVVGVAAGVADGVLPLGVAENEASICIAEPANDKETL